MDGFPWQQHLVESVQQFLVWTLHKWYKFVSATNMLVQHCSTVGIYTYNSCIDVLNCYLNKILFIKVHKHNNCTPQRVTNYYQSSPELWKQDFSDWEGQYSTKEPGFPYGPEKECQSQQWLPGADCSDGCSQRCSSTHHAGFITVLTLCQGQRASPGVPPVKKERTAPWGGLNKQVLSFGVVW